MDYLEVAKLAYKETHKDAPPDVPRWEQLHRVERDFLVEFTETVIVLADRLKKSNENEVLKE